MKTVGSGRQQAIRERFSVEIRVVTEWLAIAWSSLTFYHIRCIAHLMLVTIDVKPT